MNHIYMLPIRRLIHHPENPRKDLGDLTELAESIKKNGIMQNLTVVPEMLDGTIDTGRYRVVIGNRRMEAAKLAGLEELPCVISDMDHREQIATMLMENMQRADLTVYEQAQGFQMMMDLGFKPEEISEKTGFSETTVRRRLKMAEMDPKLLKKACEAKDTNRQITLYDFERLSQVESLKQRNALLKEIGERNFLWNLNRALDIQAANKVWKTVHKKLNEANVQELNRDERYSGKYEPHYNWQVDLGKLDPKKKFIPVDIGLLQTGAEQLFFFRDDTTLNFYTKAKKQKAEPVKKSAEELAEERERDLAWKTVDRCAEASAELRHQYMKEMTVSPKNAMRMMQWALVAAFMCMTHYDTPTMTIKKELEIQQSGLIPEIQAEIARKIMKLPQSRWPELILMMFEGDWKGNKQKPPRFADGSRGYQLPRHKKNGIMERCYEWLTEFGYQMSDEEIQMMAGTHPVFQTEVKEA